MRDTFRLVAGIALATTLIAPEIAGGVAGDIERFTNNTLRNVGILAPNATLQSVARDYSNWVDARFKEGQRVGTAPATGQAASRIARALYPHH